MKKNFFYFFLVFTLIIGYCIRVYPIMDVSPVGGRFTPGSHYSIFYTLKTGHLQSQRIKSYSYSSALVNTGIHLGEYGKILLNTIILEVIGVKSLIEMEKFFSFLPWQGLILFPSICILVSYQLSKIYNKKFYRTLFLTIWVFSILGTESIIRITNTSGISPYYGWCIYLIIFYLILKNQSMKNRIFVSMTLFYLFLIPFFHHTSALIFVTFIFIMLIYLKLRKQYSRYFNIFLIYPLVLSIYTLYFAPKMIEGYIRQFTLTVNSLLNLSFFVPYSQTELSEIVLITNSSARILVRVLDISLGTSFILIFLYLYTKKSLKNFNIDVVENIVFCWILSLFPILIFLVGWGGLSGAIFRMGYLLSIVSMISLGYLLVKASKNFRKLMYIIVIIAAISSSYSYVSYKWVGNLAWDEYKIEEWSKKTFSDQPVIFSDSRIVSPLIYHGFRKTISLNDMTNPKLFYETYMCFFVSEDPMDLKRTLETFKLRKDNIDYMILSKRFCHYPPSIVSWLNIYKPAKPNYLQKFNELVDSQLIFSSGNTFVYKIEIESSRN